MSLFKKKKKLQVDTFGDKVFLAIVYVILFISFVLVFFPLLFVLVASISDPVAVAAGEVLIFPKGITFEGYRRVFNNSEIFVGYANTILYTVIGTIINLIFTFFAAYPLSKKEFAGKTFFVIFMTIPMFISGGLVPTYLLVQGLGLLNSRFFIIIAGAVGMMNIVLVRTYMATSIPYEIQESAFIDGANDFKVFFKIILPLCGPIIAVMALFYGVGHWNEYFNSMIYLSDRDKFPLQLFLREILVKNQVAASSLTNAATGDVLSKATQARVVELIKYAVMIVSTIPVLAVYPLVQKHFVKGLMVGSIKG